ncbi:MAG TPA: MFS transporter, partial [Streptosporangiaceae bacterium]
PASFAIMPTLLPAGQLAAGNAVSAALVQVGSMAGPVLGGAVVAAAGSAPAFAVDAATFAVSALTLALIRPHRRPSRAAASSAAGQDAGHGVAADPVPGLWALLRRERILQVILVMAVMANLAGAGTFAVALPALAHAEFGAGGYGALIACVGAGTVAGTVGAARGTRLRRPAITACGCLLGFAAATALVPFLGGLPGACAALAVVGAANGFCNVIMITMLQRWAPRRLLGRVMSLVVLAAMGTYPVSVVVTGALIRIAGPRPFFPIAGAAVAAAAVFALAQREVRDFGPARKLSSWGCWRSCRARTAGRSPSTPTRPGLLPRLGPAGRVRRGTGVRHPAGGPAVGHHVALPELAIEFRAVRPGVGHPGDIPGDGSRGSRRGGVAEYLGVAALTARPGDRDAGIGRTRDEGWQAQADQS